MSIVVPKLLNVNGSDVSVWEITPEKGPKIYYERKQRAGFRPIGSRGTFRLGSANITVCDVVKPVGNTTPIILKERDGYVAPKSWYEVDPNYVGVISSQNHRDVEEVVSDDNESTEDFDE